MIPNVVYGAESSTLRHAAKDKRKLQICTRLKAEQSRASLRLTVHLNDTTILITRGD